ncbi:MAG: hypothetical protein JRI64_03645 [Deltaproteobacteria bacterium]|nr:hypothetical protein [Deltaproteobacteria bacterium]
MATMKAAIPDTFVDTFKAFLKGIPDEDFFNLFEAIMSRMGVTNPDQAVAEAHLKNHTNAFVKMMPGILDP